MNAKPRHYATRTAAERRARAGGPRAELEARAAELELADTTIRELVRQLANLARGGSLADVRIPAAAAKLVRNGDRRIREILYRAGFNSSMTVAGYAIVPRNDTTDPNPNPEE